MTSREDQRRVLADALVHEGAPLCRKYGVTRLGDLTHLDSVGIPVWTASRPTSETVTVHSGKSLIHEMARAGAVAEAVEYAAAERPKGPFVVEAASRLRVPHLEPERLPLAFGSLYRAEKPVAWEPCWHAHAQTDHWMGSQRPRLDAPPGPWAVFRFSYDHQRAGERRQRRRRLP
jgi:ribosomal protein S12 methylthiotransferase accessory factor YcaO